MPVLAGLAVLAVALLVAVVAVGAASAGERASATSAGAHVDPSGLHLWGTKLAGLAVQGTEVVFDVLGGRQWSHDPSLLGPEPPSARRVRVRVGFADRAELAVAVGRLEEWWRTGSRLSLDLPGDEPGAPSRGPRRLVMGDGARGLALLVPSAPAA